MNTATFTLNFRQIETFILSDSEFRGQVINRVLGIEGVTLESLARQALLDNPGNKIGAIKALRTASQEYPDLLPDKTYGSLGLAEAKALVEKVMGY
jgi:hypothetical protein